MSAEEPAEVVRHVRQRRERLRATMDALEAAIAAPGPGREGEWARRVAAVLDDMGPVLEDHIADTEGADGLLERVMAQAPRLAHALDALRDDHVRLREGLAALRSQADAIPGADIAEVRSAAIDLLGLLVRHRHRGADVLYEAYSVDVGAGD